MTRKQMCVGAGGVFGGSLLVAAAASAAVSGVTPTSVDFSGGYVLADGSIHAESQMQVAAAWEMFSEDWRVVRLWARVDSALDAIGSVGGSVDSNVDFILDAGDTGMFYNHPVLDQDESQNPALFTAFPTLAFDTWATIGSADGTVSPLIVGADDELNGLQSSLSCQNCGWALPSGADPGVVIGWDGNYRVLLGQFTLRRSSYFYVQGQASGGGTTLPFWGESFPPGAVPGPATAGVFAMAGMMGRRRRRR